MKKFIHMQIDQYLTYLKEILSDVSSSPYQSPHKSFSAKALPSTNLLLIEKSHQNSNRPNKKNTNSNKQPSQSSVKEPS